MDSPGVGPISPAVQLIKTVSKIFLDPSGKEVGKADRQTSVEPGLQKHEGLVARTDIQLEKFPSVESLLPLKILASPLLMRSEWAWKLLLATALETGEQPMMGAGERAENVNKAFSEGENLAVDVQASALAQNETLASGTAQITRTGSRYEAAVQVLWSILASAADENGRATWRTEVHNLHAKGPLVEFSQLKHADMSHLSAAARQWVIEDRLTSSVQFESYERIGQGLFVPPNQSGRLHQVAHRYHARKQTRITGRGKLVHRIQFDIRVRDNPVRCTIICAKPSLLVHFDTNDSSLRNHLTVGQDALKEVLKDEGWQLEQWTVSPFEDEKEVRK